MNGRFRLLILGFYAWISGLFVGTILLDMAYAKILRSVLEFSNRSVVFNEISDTLLCIGFLLILSAILAIVVSWKSPVPRNLFITSLIFFSSEFLLPFLFSFIKLSHDISWIRLMPVGMASMLAIIGLYKSYRSEKESVKYDK